MNFEQTLIFTLWQYLFTKIQVSLSEHIVGKLVVKSPYATSVSGMLNYFANIYTELVHGDVARVAVVALYVARCVLKPTSYIIHVYEHIYAHVYH